MEEVDQAMNYYSDKACEIVIEKFSPKYLRKYLEIIAWEYICGDDGAWEIWHHDLGLDAGHAYAVNRHEQLFEEWIIEERAQSKLDYEAV